MNRKHYISQMAWAAITWAFMHNRALQAEYNAYKYRCWESGLAAYDDRQFLHRKLFPKKYDYEVQCPECKGTLTSYGLCMECGNRWDVVKAGRKRYGRPL